MRSPGRVGDIVANSRLAGSFRASRALGEFLLIVAGVTVALGAESLWAARLDRLREAEYMEQLRSDLAENQRRLDVAILDEETIGAAALTALQAVMSGEPIPVDSAQAWVVERRGLFYSDPRLLTGTFSGLVESGDLRLVRDPTIRKAIIAYVPQVVSDRAEFDRWVDTFIAGLVKYRPSPRRGAVEDPTTFQETVNLVASGSPVAAELLDHAIWTNTVRLIYLRRMLAATDSVASVLAP
jgi:hypothetical protein